MQMFMQLGLAVFLYVDFLNILPSDYHLIHSIQFIWSAQRLQQFQNMERSFQKLIEFKQNHCFMIDYQP